MVAGRVLSRRAVTCLIFAVPDSSATCESFADDWGLSSVDELKRLNPGITCPDLDTSKTYCVAGTVTDDQPTTTSTQSSSASQTSTTIRTTITTQSSTATRPPTTTSAPPTTTTTRPGNGITTPTPAHPGMVSNCNKFAYVNPGDTCDNLAFFNGPIATEDLILWNTGVGGRECRSLQANTYVCIGVIGGSTPTQTGNGIATPVPTHPGMVSNCNKFTYVNPGDTCDNLAFFNGPIATEDFVLWNTGVGGRECRGLQAHTYVCVGVIGGGTPTQPGNGIATPYPPHPGMVSNCNKFTRVNPGDTCDNIAFFNGPISTENFVLWNAGVGGRECWNLQANTYACVGVIG
ncbi:hypothetical protein C8A00DRAFT_13653 [Chaetomidium leptoderma]|uniref:LysM domain-containing protein n=1 Tax=Chaetomidium leptoderma TaxID=669021 RepID=A0AAN6VPE7_9PEZI|nr:hypothetical protein C8A00DRAFT_13653 [Chaetomidium leptoderma]